MESLLRIFLLLCLSSLAANLKITSPIKLNNKNIDLGILTKPLSNGQRSGMPSNLQVNNNQCFCISKNTDSKLVTDHLVTQDQDIERLVVYLYRVNGLLRAFIPNKQKQVMIPDLTFDLDQGDVIKGVSQDPVVDLFGSGPIITEPNFNPETPATDAPDFKQVDNVDENVDPMEIDDDFFHIPTKQIDLPDVIELPDLPPIPDVNIPEPSLDFPENSPVHIPDIQETDTEDYPIIDITENDSSDPIVPTADTAGLTVPQPELSILDDLPMPVEIQNSINPPMGPTSNIPEPSHSSKQNIPLGIQEILHLQDSLYDKPTEEKIKIIIDIINSSLHAIKNNPQSKHDHLHQILYILPPQAIAYVKSQFPQLLLEYPGDSVEMESHFITFDNWFKEQLKRMFSQNLEISYIIKLRDRILSILKKNGMHFATNGNLYDAEGNLIKISNIKLRVILIGDLIEYEKMLNNDETYKLSLGGRLPYHQIILIFHVNPTRALGILPIGKVYLPRNFEGGPDLEHFDWRSGRPLRQVSCVSKNCMYSKPKWSPLVPYPRASMTRRDFSTEELGLRNQPTQFEDFNVSQQPDSRDGNILQVLLKLLGTSDIANQSRRFFGGNYLKDKPSPGVLPHDDLPGVRIVGGHAATSSGTPLVSKGRSG